MKFSYSPYELRFTQGGAVRKGMLVRIEQADSFGYADCHPWVELGDQSLETQIASLQILRLTPLLDRTIHFAKIDWIARRMNKSLFEGLPSVPGYVIVAKPEQNGHPLQKLKVRPGEEQAFIQKASKEIHWGLDFNNSFNLEQCKAFLSRLRDYKIDYIEDPLPSKPGLWKSLQETYGIPFASDFEDNPEATFLIEKPAARSLSANDKRRKVVTSYLDHPLGQLSALYTAASVPYLQKEPGGFLSHLIYEPNPFSSQFIIKEGCLVPPQGPGWGFQELLKHLNWFPL
jgi:O-succinylbenzoate synthase